MEGHGQQCQCHRNIGGRGGRILHGVAFPFVDFDTPEPAGSKASNADLKFSACPARVAPGASSVRATKRVTGQPAQSAKLELHMEPRTHALAGDCGPSGQEHAQQKWTIECFMTAADHRYSAT